MFRIVLNKTFSKIPFIRSFISCQHKDSFTLVLESKDYGVVHFHKCKHCDRVYSKFITFKNLELRKELIDLTNSIEFKSMNKDTLIYTLGTWIKHQANKNFKLFTI